VAKLVFKCLFIISLFTIACTGGRIGDGWADAIEDRRFIQEGEGEDDIPAINDPKFTLASQVDYLEDTSIVLGICHEGIIKAYPLDILHWHEIVNDRIGDSTYIAITYSTLSGSGIAFDRVLNNGLVFEMGVSGLLYNSNLIASDNVSDSYWLQILGLGVKGIRMNQELEEFPIIEMKWSTWRLLFPNSEVLNTATGFNRPYQTYPYGDYRTNNEEFLFDLTVSLDSLDTRIPFKEKALAVMISADTMVYPMSAFPESGVKLIQEEMSGQAVLVVGSREHQMITAFERKRADESIAFFKLADSTRLIFEDERGVQYDIFGKTVGSDSGNNLKPMNAKNAYWFNWAVWSHPNKLPIYQ